MNSAPTELQVSTRPPSKEALMDWLTRTAHPVLRAVRELVNGLAQNTVQTVTSSLTLNPGTDLALVSASAGPVTVTLPAPAVWERRIVIVKTDPTANVVTILGAAHTITLSNQYDIAEVSSDGVTYYPVGASQTLAGDVIGPAGSNTVVRLQNRPLAAAAPIVYQLIRSLDGTSWTPAYEGYPAGPVPTATFSLGAGSVDSVAFTVPALPAGISRFALQRIYGRLETALGGADTGTVAYRVGLTVGGNELITDQTIDKTTPVGTVVSFSAATRGASVLVANRYEVLLAAGATVNVRVTTTGTISAGSIKTNVYGAFLP